MRDRVVLWAGVAGLMILTLLVQPASAAPGTKHIFRYSGGLGTSAATNRLDCLTMPPRKDGLYGNWRVGVRHVIAKTRVTPHRFHIRVHGFVRVRFVPIRSGYPMYKGLSEFSLHVIVPNAVQNVFAPYTMLMAGSDGSMGTITNAVQFFTVRNQGVVGIGTNNGFECVSDR